MVSSHQAMNCVVSFQRLPTGHFTEWSTQFIFL